LHLKKLALAGLMTAVGWAAPEKGQLDGSRELFTLFAALEAAGQEFLVTSPLPLRTQVGAEIAKRQVPVLKDLREFFASHAKDNRNATLSQYISFALCLTPEYKFRYRQVELPPDVVPLGDLADLLKKFDAQAGIEELWKRSQPAYEQALQFYHEPVSAAILEVNTYLRNVTSGFFGRQFQIYVDLFGSPAQVHTRSYGDDYFVIVSPPAAAQPSAADLRIPDIRHAYMHYLLDPTVVRHGEELMKKKAIGDYAIPAPALPDQYKSDFTLLVTESLIKVVEARLSGKNRDALASQALAEGYILVPFFMEQLTAFEKQESSFRLYFPEVVAALDLKKEDQRLVGVKFADKAADRPSVKRAAPEPSVVEKTLREAEELYDKQQFDQAKLVFARAIRETEERAYHARVYFGLGRIAIRQRNPELAENLFQKALELEPDGFTHSWSLIYLGRLADAAEERETAMKHYRAALAVPGATEAAKSAAQKGLEKGFEK
jgi:tetratricopeptide (TPR) repeat protein